jgi:hypothetical protein
MTTQGRRVRREARRRRNRPKVEAFAVLRMTDLLNWKLSGQPGIAVPHEAHGSVGGGTSVKA